MGYLKSVLYVAHDVSLGANDSVSLGPDVFSGLTCVAPGGIYIIIIRCHGLYYG